MTLTDTTIPKRLPKTADTGDCRYYGWTCDCGTHWAGVWHSPAAFDSDCSEPYTLRQDGQECDNFSFESAAEMHAGFHRAVQPHRQADEWRGSEDLLRTKIDLAKNHIWSLNQCHDIAGNLSVLRNAQRDLDFLQEMLEHLGESA